MTTVGHNVTTTVTSVSVQRVTTTAAGKITVQSVPWEFYLIGLFVVIFGVVAWVFLKLQVKEIPVVVDFLQENYQALEVRAKRDLNGVFVKLFRSGKHVETIKGVTKPFEVTILDNGGNAWTIDDKLTRMDDALKRIIARYGMNLTPNKMGGWRHRKEIKGYLLTEPKPPDKALAYFNVNLGGLKRVTRYMTVQGTGKTVDPMEVVREATTEEDANGNGPEGVDTSAMTHELLSAGKETVRIINEGTQGNGKLFMGIGIGAMLGLSVLLLVLVLSGHLH